MTHAGRTPKSQGCLALECMVLEHFCFQTAREAAYTRIQISCAAMKFTLVASSENSLSQPNPLHSKAGTWIRHLSRTNVIQMTRTVPEVAYIALKIYKSQSNIKCWCQEAEICEVWLKFTTTMHQLGWI